MFKLKSIKFAFLLFINILTIVNSCFSQGNRSISGHLRNKNNEPLAFANVLLEKTHFITTANESGYFTIKNVPAGKYVLLISMLGYEKLSKEIIVKGDEDLSLQFILKDEMGQLNPIVIEAEREKVYTEKMPEIRGTDIFSGKKTEVIALDKIDANLAENNTRQIFSKVPGISAWEMDGAGVQVSISSRGLNPHRSWEFNVNQNGFNINSDLFGYPEAHYNPPMEAVQKIEIARGSAALQYGPQFGGMLNYVIKSPDTSKAFGLESQQTFGSFGMINTYNAIGGKKGKWTYYAYFNYRGSNGWRPSSRYDFFASHASLQYQLSKKVKMGLEFSRMNYVIQFGGGLSDLQFNQNARQSLRNRNYFNPDIMLPAFFMEANLNDKTKLSLKTYVLTGERNSVQIISSPLQADLYNNLTNSYSPRQVDRDYYLTYTADLRLIRNYKLFNLDQYISGGIKYSHARTLRKQRGIGTTTSDFDLSLINPIYGIDLAFTTINQAVYFENLFRITRHWTITPGIRLDHIQSSMKGELTALKLQGRSYDAIRNNFIFGIGSEYMLTDKIGLYANYSTAFRPILHSDLIPSATIAVVDPSLKDASGYNLDIGSRGKVKNIIDYDISFFMLYYGNRIGTISLQKTDGSFYPYRTNTGNTLTKGIESFIEFHPLNMFNFTHKLDISVFNSLSLNNARYQKGTLFIDKKNISITNHYVEDVPDFVSRSGISFSKKAFSISVLYSLVGMSYSDANNTIASVEGYTGVVPSYHLFDASAAFRFKDRYNVKAGINNLADVRYFTRRSTGYPGPGILPGDGRSYFVSVGLKI